MASLDDLMAKYTTTDSEQPTEEEDNAPIIKKENSMDALMAKYETVDPVQEGVSDPESAIPGKPWVEEEGFSGMGAAPFEEEAEQLDQMDNVRAPEVDSPTAHFRVGFHDKLSQSMADPAQGYDDLTRTSYVKDGDTFDTTDGRTIRIIGIDTPETGKEFLNTTDQPFAKAALADLTKMVEGVDIKLVDGKEAVGAHGRELKYVQLPDGRDVGAELLRRGYAVVMPVGDTDPKDGEYQRHQGEAMANKAGIWSQRKGKYEVLAVKINIDPDGSDHPGLSDNKEITKYWSLQDPTNIKGVPRKATAMETFKYAFENTNTDVQHLRNLMDASTTLTAGGKYGRDPITGEMEFNSNKELYGLDFDDLDFEERVLRINRVESAYTTFKYRDVVADMDDNQISEFLGTMVGAMATPTSLIGGGAAYNVAKAAGTKAAMTFGARYGAAFAAEYSALQQYATDLDIDFKELTIDTVTGGIFGWGTTGAGIVAAKGFSKVNQVRINSKTHKRANINVDKLTVRQAQKVYKDLVNDVIEKRMQRFELRENEIRSATLPNGPKQQSSAGLNADRLKMELAREIEDRQAVSAIIAKEWPTIAADPKKLEAKTGWALPYVTEDAATLAASLPNDGSMAGLNWWRNNKFSKMASDFLGNQETELRNHAPEIAADLKKADVKLGYNEGTYQTAVQNIEKALHKQGIKKDIDKLWEVLGDQDWDRLKNSQHLSPESKQAVADLNTLLGKYKDKLIVNRIIKADDAIPDYFPRRVKDLEKVKKNATPDQLKLINRRLEETRKRIADYTGIKDRQLTEHEASMAVSSLWTNNANMVKRGNAKTRTIDGPVPANIKEGYDTPKDALLSYFSDMDAEIAMREFFDVANNPGLVNKHGSLNLDAAIHNKIAFLKRGAVRKAGVENRSVHELTARYRLGTDAEKEAWLLKRNITPEGKAGTKAWDAKQNLAKASAYLKNKVADQNDGFAPSPISKDSAAELSRILHARFNPNRNDVADWARRSKQMGHFTLLAQFTSAAVQTADAGMTAYRVSARDTITSIGKVSLNRLGITKAAVDAKMDAGITKAMHEISNTKGLGKQVDRGMRWTGFTAIDNFNKDVLITAALSKGSRMSGSIAGKKQLYNKYASYGDEFVSKMVRDLNVYNNASKADKPRYLTNTIKTYILNEAYDTQPINPSQVPLWVQNHPNASAMTTLMSYTMKGFDIIRNDIIYAAAKGDVVTAAANLTKFAVAVGGTNAAVRGVIDFMQGRDVYADEWFERMMDEMSTFLFTNRYMRDRLGDSANANEWIAGLTSIPTLAVVGQLITAAITKAELMMEDKEVDTPQDSRTRTVQEQMAYDRDNAGDGRTASQDKRIRAGKTKLPVVGKLFWSYKQWDKDVGYNKKVQKEREKKAEENKEVSTLQRISIGN